MGFERPPHHAGQKTIEIASGLSSESKKVFFRSVPRPKKPGDRGKVQRPLEDRGGGTHRCPASKPPDPGLRYHNAPGGVVVASDPARTTGAPPGRGDTPRSSVTTTRGPAGR